MAENHSLKSGQAHRTAYVQSYLIQPKKYAFEVTRKQISFPVLTEKHFVTTYKNEKCKIKAYLRACY